MKYRTCTNPDCPLPQPLPLTKTYFYRRKTGLWQQPCRKCWCAQIKANKKRTTQPRYLPSLEQIKAMRKIIDKEKREKMED